MGINLGSWDGEMDVNEGDDLLAMHYINGSGEFCADRNTTFARSTDIYHFCGSSNQIVSVHEATECIYTIMFSVNCTDDDNNYDNNYDQGSALESVKGSALPDVVAGAQTWTCGNRDPLPCDFDEWVENNWWASAVESLNFASKNWEEFTNAVKSVSRTEHILKGK